MSGTITPKTLSAFGVPLASSLLQTRPSHRFKAIFAEIGSEPECVLLQQQVVSIERPNVVFDTKTSEVRWHKVKLVLRDDNDSHTMLLLERQISRQSADPDATFDIEVQQLDGSMNEQGGYHLLDCRIEAVSFGTLNCKTSEPVEITVVLQPESAVFNF